MARAHRGWKTRLGSVELRAPGCHMALGLQQQQLGASCPDRALPRLLSPWVLGVTGGGRAEQWSSAAREDEPESSAGADSAARCSCPPGSRHCAAAPCGGGSCPTGHGTPPRSCQRDTATRLALRGELGGWAALRPLLCTCRDWPCLVCTSGSRPRFHPEGDRCHCHSPKSTPPVFCFLWSCWRGGDGRQEGCGLGVLCPGVDGDSVTRSSCRGSSAGMDFGEL